MKDVVFFYVIEDGIHANAIQVGGEAYDKHKEAVTDDVLSLVVRDLYTNSLLEYAHDLRINEVIDRRKLEDHFPSTLALEVVFLEVVATKHREDKP